MRRWIVAVCMMIGCLQADQVQETFVKSPLSVANLNLYRQGNMVVVRPGEKIYGTINFFCDTEHMNPEALNQIVVGFAEMGPQTCIFHERGYRCSDKGILSLVLQAPSEPGVYDVLCYLAHAYSPAEAMLSWWGEGEEVTSKVVVGRVVVK